MSQVQVTYGSVQITIPINVESLVPIGACSLQIDFPKGIKPKKVTISKELKSFTKAIEGRVDPLNPQRVSIGFISPLTTTSDSETTIKGSQEGFQGKIGSITLIVTDLGVLGKFTSQSDISDKLANVIWKPGDSISQVNTTEKSVSSV